jgi:hypothetical protein
MSNKNYTNIDQLIVTGKEEEACALIEQVLAKRESDNQGNIAKLILRFERLQRNRHVVQEIS